MTVENECMGVYMKSVRLESDLATCMIVDHRQVVTIDSIPDAGVVPCLAGADSGVTCPCPVHSISTQLLHAQGVK